MRILYFGSYDPGYARNSILIGGLKANGAEVFECNSRLKRRLKVFLDLLLKYWKFAGKYDVMIVGFPGQETMFLARLLRPFGFIVFDAFTSHYGGYVLDRKKAAKNSFKAKWYRFLDTYSCRLANLILLDTNAHIDFFVEEFKLPRKKFKRIWAGADNSLLKPVENRIDEKGKFKVLFFGTYIPLQGIEHIVRAARIILDSDKNIEFKIVGNGQDREKIEILAENIGADNVEFKDGASLSELKKEIAGSEVCLGIFGGTLKASLVIPNKVYDSVAMEKPVITADTPAVRELFDEEELYLVKPADPESLAKAVIKLKNDPGLRNKLARNGYLKFKNSASLEILGKELLETLNRSK